MRDWWVDGHYIAARTAADALREVRMLYNYDAESVRPWTTEDQEAVENG